VTEGMRGRPFEAGILLSGLWLFAIPYSLLRWDSKTRPTLQEGIPEELSALLE